MKIQAIGQNYYHQKNCSQRKLTKVSPTFNGFGGKLQGGLKGAMTGGLAWALAAGSGGLLLPFVAIGTVVGAAIDSKLEDIANEDSKDKKDNQP